MDGIQAVGPGVAPSPDIEKLRKTAQELEGVFLGVLLKTMHASGAGATEGPDAATYREMFDAEVGRSLARAGGIGLAKLICDGSGAGEVKKPLK